MAVTFLRLLCASLFAAGLMGCSGDPVTFNNSPEVVTFQPLGTGAISGSEAVSVINELNDLAAPSNTIDVSLGVPSSASASYNGVVAFDLDANRSVMGRMLISANFAGNTVSGSAGDFTIFDESGVDPIPIEQMSGALPMSSGTISTTTTGAGPLTTMAANMNGTLSASAGTYGVTSTLSGTFLIVSGQSIVGGNMDGTLNTPTSTNQTIAGRMIAAE